MDHPRTLAGRYELAEPLGSGGMGGVFRSADRLLGRTVAVKVLAPHMARDRRAVSRFRREARSAAGLAHPSIVSVFDSGSENGWHYLVMEHVDGRTLGQILRQEGPLHPRRAAEVAAELARALSHAHQAGIVHRDVKPGNLMIASDGQVKVVDFGIAAAVSSDTATATAAVLGTVSYLAPEQVHGRPPDPRSDLYALGVVLYEMLTGRPPFVADTPLAVAYKHAEEDPVPPSVLNPDVPPALEAVVMRALAKDPDDRYPSAEAVLADLEGYLEDPDLDPVATVGVEGGEDADPTATEWHAGSGTHRARRRRRWMVAAAAATLATAVPAALVLSSGDEARTTPPESGTRAPDRDRSADEVPGEASPSPSTAEGGDEGKEGQAPSRAGSESEEEEEGPAEEPEPSPTPSPTPSPSPSPSGEPSPTPSSTTSP